MTRMTWLAPLAAATLSACAQPAPEQQIINDAATALGGSDRIQAIKTLVMEGEGTNGNLGQDMTPDATEQSFAVTGYRRAIDVAGGRARTEPELPDMHAIMMRPSTPRNRPRMKPRPA